MQIQLNIPPEHPLAGLLAEAQLAERSAAFYDMLSLEIRREIDEASRSRQRTEALIDRLIQGLDQIDDDPDLEPYLAGTSGRDGDDREGVLGLDEDYEPMLGATERHPPGQGMLGHPNGPGFLPYGYVHGVERLAAGDQRVSWAGTGTTVWDDECENVCEDEGTQCDDEGVTRDDDEYTSCETYGRGFTMNGGICADDAEDDDSGGCEHDGREPDLGW